MTAVADVFTQELVRPAIREAAMGQVSLNRDIISSPSMALKAMIDEVLEFTRFEQNRDREDGVPVSMDAAKASLRTLSAAVSYGLTPLVMPLGDGGLIAEWKHGNRLLQIEWSETGSSEYNLANNGVVESEGSLPPAPGELFFRLVAAAPNI